MKSWWTIFAVGAVCCWPLRADACGTCSVGDPTLTVVGFEQPKSNRIRTSATVRHRSDSIGEEDIDRLELAEQRLEIAGAYSPTDRWTLSLMMPLVRRFVTAVNLAEADIWAPGDLDLRVRTVVYRDSAFAPKHLIATIAGLEFPTSTIERDAAGVPLPLEFQAGTGSWDPIVGASYTMFSDPWSVYLSSVAVLTTRGTADTRAPKTFRHTALGQYQPWHFLAFQLGVEFRVDGPGYIGDTRDPDTGGWITYGSIGALAMPHDNVLLHFTAAIPMVQRLDGSHREGIALLGGLIYEI